MKPLLVFAVLLLVAVPCLAQADVGAQNPEIDSERDFVKAWLEALVRSGGLPEHEIGLGVELILLKDGVRMAVRGDNAYRGYVEDPTTRGAQLAILVNLVRDTMAQGPKPLQSTSLLWVVKPQGWLDQSGLTTWSRHLPGGLVAVLAEDRGDHTQYVSEAELKALGLPFESLAALAVENLPRIAPLQEEDLGGGVLMLTSGGDYEASLALDRETIEALAERLGGAVTFAIPTSDTFLLAKREDQLALVRLANAICALQAQPKALSTDFFAYDSKRLVSVGRVDCTAEQIKLTLD